MEYLNNFFTDFADILNEMSPYLILGFLFAGILHVFFPKDKINKYMGQRNASSVINASILGVPLPLCSCGVIPTGISFYKNGASKGSAISFLTSTPQTGFDSILVTYSLLGLPFAIIRPIIAFITGIFGGILTNAVDKKHGQDMHTQESNNVNKGESGNAILKMLRYAFYDFLDDIAKWLVVGLVIAAVISVIIPDDFFTTSLSNQFLNMLIILVASIPVYVCATASVPIAAILMLKGLSPGAALVLLMAGPATNAATITVIGKTLGKKTLFVYLFSIIAGAMIFGFIIDVFLPESWFILPGNISGDHIHHHELIPYWLKIASSIFLSFFILRSLITNFLEKRKIKRLNKQTIPIEHVQSRDVIIEGMTCNHCKQTVEGNLLGLEGINKVEADINTNQVKISGGKVDLKLIEDTVSKLGYDYKGEV